MAGAIACAGGAIGWMHWTDKPEPAAGRPSWSSDSNAIAFLREGDIVQVDVASGVQSELLREKASEFAFAPGGSYLFGTGEKGLFWAVPGSGRTQLTVQKPDEGLHVNP